MELIKQYFFRLILGFERGFFGHGNAESLWQARFKSTLLFSGTIYLAEFGEEEVLGGEILPRETTNFEAITVIFIGLINERLVAANSSPSAMLLKPTTGEEVLPMISLLVRTYEQPMLLIVQQCSLILDVSAQKGVSKDRQILEFYWNLRNIVRDKKACVIVTEVPEVTELLAASYQRIG